MTPTERAKQAMLERIATLWHNDYTRNRKAYETALQDPDTKELAQGGYERLKLMNIEFNEMLKREGYN